MRLEYTGVKITQKITLKAYMIKKLYMALYARELLRKKYTTYYTSFEYKNYAHNEA